MGIWEKLAKNKLLRRRGGKKRKEKEKASSYSTPIQLALIQRKVAAGYGDACLLKTLPKGREEARALA